MGAQSAINGLIGTAGAAVASVAGAVKSGKDKKAENQEEGLLAKAQYYEAKAKQENLENQKGSVAEEAKAAGDAYEKLMGRPEASTEKGKKLQEGYRSKALSRKEAAERALASLQDEIEGTKALQARALLRMQRTGNGGIK